MTTLLLSVLLIGTGVYFLNEKADVSNLVSVAGVLWERENLPEMMELNAGRAAAEAKGMRLPTKQEWDNLRACPSVYDEERKGNWYADNEADLKNPEKSIFFPFAGYIENGSHKGIGTNSLVWSSTVKEDNHNYYHRFSMWNGGGDTNYCSPNILLSIRCVK